MEGKFKISWSGNSQNNKRNQVLIDIHAIDGAGFVPLVFLSAVFTDFDKLPLLCALSEKQKQKQQNRKTNFESREEL